MRIHSALKRRLSLRRMPRKISFKYFFSLLIPKFFTRPPPALKLCEKHKNVVFPAKPGNQGKYKLMDSHFPGNDVKVIVFAQSPEFGNQTSNLFINLTNSNMKRFVFICHLPTCRPPAMPAQDVAESPTSSP